MTFTPGPRPSVRFRRAGQPDAVTASLVVGADLRASVVRRCAGVALQKSEALGYIAGLLLPAGPCATFPGTDTWTDRPFAPGAVLIGDVAGHNDPTAGCGLSIAMRDARMVAELVLAGGQGPCQFEPYGEEHVERLRRLRLIADLVNVASVETAPNRSRRRRHFAAAMAAMDPQIFPLMLGMFAGPETVPPDLVTNAVLDRIRAA